jgi:hypothetical protein
MDWILDLLTTCTHHSELHVITELPPISTLYKSLGHAKSSQSPLVVSLQRLLTLEIFQLPAFRSFCHSCPCRTLVKSLNWQMPTPKLSTQFSAATATYLVAISSRLPSTVDAQLTLSIILSWPGVLVMRVYSPEGHPTENAVFVVIAQQYSSCCLRIRCRRGVFTEPLPGNECLLWLHYSGFQVSCHNIFSTKNYNSQIICFLDFSEFLKYVCILFSLKNIFGNKSFELRRVFSPVWSNENCFHLQNINHLSSFMCRLNFLFVILRILWCRCTKLFTSNSVSLKNYILEI